MVVWRTNLPPNLHVDSAAVKLNPARGVTARGKPLGIVSLPREQVSCCPVGWNSGAQTSFPVNQSLISSQQNVSRSTWDSRISTPAPFRNSTSKSPLLEVRTMKSAGHPQEDWICSVILAVAYDSRICMGLNKITFLSPIPQIWMKSGRHRHYSIGQRYTSRCRGAS